ncbi:MAG: 4Fe-4S dicluster domain-containing protein [Desulfomonilia bacterium]
MAEYVKYIDLTKCTGCRACQVACKQWNDLPAETTQFSGSLQNPLDLSYTTWTLIRFDELSNGSDIQWIMRHDACMHCDWPACVKACPSPGALVRMDNGAVVHNPDYCIGCKACIVGCPFDIPRYSREDEKIAKCTLCYDRITNGMKPACVTACNTGCLDFGPKEAMIEKAHARALETGGTVYPSNPNYETHVLYVLPPDVKPADLSHMNPNPKMPTTILWWKNLFKPFTLIGMGGVAGLAILHYMLRGPHLVEEKKKEGGEADV